MKAEIIGQAIIVDLSSEEVFKVQAGGNIGDRSGVTLPDAKINVWPLSAIEPDNSLKDHWSMDRLEIGLKAPFRGRLDTDGDLSIFVPAIKLSDVRIAKAHLPRKSIETPSLKGEDRETFLSSVIPKKGVIVNFGGSLRKIDTDSCYYDNGQRRTTRRKSAH